MTVELVKRVHPGNMRCSVLSSSPCIHEEGPCIVIPIAHVAKWTDKEIVAIIRGLVPYGEQARALSFADWIVSNSGRSGEVPLSVFDDYAEDIACLERWRGQDQEIDAALACLDRTRERIRFREKAPSIRREMRVNYDRLFVKIVRRDGFACQHCGSTTTDLTIDHKTPVIKGGTNAVENLQLLCPACNREKHDK